MKYVVIGESSGATPEGALRLEPQENGGASGEARGYRPIAGAAVVLPSASPAGEVGRTVRAALDRSRLNGKPAL